MEMSNRAAYRSIALDFSFCPEPYYKNANTTTVV